MAALTGQANRINTRQALRIADVAHEGIDRLLELGIYVIGFSFPVVPRGAARIRTQMSAAHTREHLTRAIEAFTTAGRELGLIP